MFSEIDNQIFFAASTLGNIVMIDVRSGHVLRTYKGHAASINDFIEVKQHNLVITAGDDFVCNVFDLSKEPDSALKKKEIKEKKSEDI
jgi:WD40 repeat protein